MRHVTINLDPERSAKLQQIAEATAGHVTQIEVAGQTFDVQQRKISASAVAISILNAAIDDIHAKLPQ